jgi:hypothetical protein
MPAYKHSASLKPLGKVICLYKLALTEFQFGRYRKNGSKEDASRIRESNGTNLELAFLMSSFNVVVGVWIWRFVINAVEGIDAKRR